MRPEELDAAEALGARLVLGAASGMLPAAIPGSAQLYPSIGTTAVHGPPVLGGSGIVYQGYGGSSLGGLSRAPASAVRSLTEFPQTALRTAAEHGNGAYGQAMAGTPPATPLRPITRAARERTSPVLERMQWRQGLSGSGKS
jgi:hypothetical protein